MKNIINLLDKMGANAELNKLDGEALAKVINPLDLDDAVQNAILAQNTEALEQLLNTRNKIVCAICPAEEEPTKEPSDDEEEQEDKEEKALVSNAW